MRFLLLATLLTPLALQASNRRQLEPKSKPTTPPKADQEAIQGAWKVVGLESGGKAEPAQNHGDSSFTFSANKATLKEGTHPPIEFKFTLDASTSPKSIDLTAKNATSHGIYKLDGDDLVVCLSIGGARPGEFATKAGGDTETFTLRRNRWEAFTDKGAGFTVRMPGKPEELKREVAAPGGARATTLYAVRDEGDGVQYSVWVTPLPGKPDAKESDGVALAVRDQLVAEVGRDAKATATDETPFRVAQVAGKDTSWSLELPAAKSKATLRVRQFVSGGRSYSLAVAGPEAAVKAADVAQFWGSFRTPAEKKKP